MPIEKKAPLAKMGAPDPSKGGTAEKGEGAPVASPSEKTAALENVPAGITTYTVQQGDTLYGISVKAFGTPRYYERIFEENRDRIADPNTLQIGLNLKMPNVPAKAGAGVPGVKGKEPGPIPAVVATPPAVETGSKDLR
jgi:nucleoid-associated protein YgaU